MKNTKKKIIFVTASLGRGGAEVLLLELSKRLMSRGYEVLVVSIMGGGELESAFIDAGIPLQILHKKDKLGLGVLLTLIRLFKKEQPDIVHTHLFAGDTWGRLAAQLAGVPTIISTEHNINKDEGSLKHWVKRFLARWTDKVIVISEQVKEYSLSEVEVAPEKIQLIYNGVDLEKFSFRQSHEYFVPGIKAVVVGQLREQKGHIYLLEALPDIIAKYPSFSLDIIGGGSRENELKKRAEKLGVSHAVRFLGSRPVDGSALSMYDLFILPSLWEGLGIAVLEAQAVGVPVIASQVDGITELIEHKQTGIFTEPKDSQSIVEAVTWAVEHMEKLPIIAENARKRVEDGFSIKKMVDAYEAVYEGPSAKKSLKILQVNKFFYPKGGSESVFFATKALLVAKGHEVIDFSMKDEKNLDSQYSEYFIEHIDFQKREGFLSDVHKALGAIYNRDAQKKLERLIKATRPDVAHLHNFHTQFTPSILKTFKKYNIPVVWTMHDKFVVEPQSYRGVHDFFTYMQNLITKLEVYVHKYLLHSYRYIDMYISPSKFLKRKIHEWGVGENVEQIYNMVDVEATPPSFEPGEYVLFIGRLSEEKGLDVLLKAAKDLPRISFKIVGDGPYLEKAQKYLQIHDMENVEFAGFKRGAELASLIHGCAFVVVPSGTEENNPMVILESFAHGKPVIGSKLGGIPELINGESRGLLFEAGDGMALCDAIKKLYESPNLIQELGKNAREFVEDNCAVEKHYERLMDVYKSVLDPSASSGQAQSKK